MIEGAVNADLEAVVTISVQLPDGRTREVEAVIDTGYTDELMLSSSLIADLGLPFSHVSGALLANDNYVSFNVYGATILWDGQARPIEVDAAGSTPLLGMRMLEGYGLALDVQRGGRVTIEALS